MSGYHGAGSDCVPDIPCNDNSCNHHGFCSSSNGYPECQCNDGYATIGVNFCGVCALGYQGYPTCVPVPDAFDEGTRCKADLLPTSLNDMAYLGFDGEVRLQGHFFIDPLKREHAMTFALQQKSAMRVHLSPHWVDVDIALYLKAGGKEKLIADGGYRMNTEETLFVTLDPTTGDDTYLLRFRYYLFSTTVPDCETLNLELVIAPLTRALAMADANKDSCRAVLASATSLPSTTINVESGQDYEYAPTTFFAVNGTNVPKSGSTIGIGSAPMGYFFWNVTFTLPKAPEGKVIVLHAEAGASFLQDSVAILLERGSAQTHCSTGNTDSTCLTGLNIYNKNVLDTIVGPGTYTLWLFQPRLPLTNCSLFDFSMRVNFTNSWRDTFFCEGARFPRSLNEPNYLDYNGILHFQDDFLLQDSIVPVNFTITTTSYFKIAATAELVLGFDLFLFNATKAPADYLAHSASGMITAKLTPGTYLFEILVFEQLIGDECPLVNVELAIMPVNIPDHTGGESCMNDVEKLPALPENLGSAPYKFNMSDADGVLRYVTFKSGEVASYPITVSEVMWLIVEITSDFLTGDVRPEMHIDTINNAVPVPGAPHRSSTDEVVPFTQRTAMQPAGRANQEANHRFGTHNYNLNRLDWFLTPGHYTLKITRPGTVGPDSPLAPCGVFNFALNLQALGGNLCEGNPKTQFDF